MPENNLENFIHTMLADGKIHQLKVPGLLLLMSIFAEKEKNANQPFIAGSIASLQNVIGLMDDSAPGSEITVIFTAPEESPNKWKELIGKNKYAKEFSFHKTSFKIKKTSDYIEILHLDSVSNNPDYIDISNMLIVAALKAHALGKQKDPTPMLSLEPLFPKNVENKKREFNGKQYVEVVPNFQAQKDNYNCGVYAVKIARYLIRSVEINLLRDMHTSEIITEKVITSAGDYYQQKFVVTPEMLRSSQSNTTLEHLSNDPYNQDSIVNRKGLSLKDFLKRYKTEPGSYILKFAKKYLETVKSCLVKESPEQIKERLKQYDCSNLSPEDIIRLNKKPKDLDL